jgi:hypothetical protein
VVMPTMRWRIPVGLLPVVEVALVPRGWLLRRRVRPLWWSPRRRVRLRVPCGNITRTRIRSAMCLPNRNYPRPRWRDTIRRCIARQIHAGSQKGDGSICTVTDALGMEKEGISDGERRSRNVSAIGDDGEDQRKSTCLAVGMTPGSSGSSWRRRRLTVLDRFSSWSSRGC